MTRRSNLSDGPVRPARRSRRIHTLPHDDAGCGWLNLLPPPPPARRLAGAERADSAVIGAGFTGLAIARRLAAARPEQRIAVVEAQRAGFGASGRSSGFVVDLAHFIARMPEAAGRAYVALSRLGIGALRDLVRTHGIACDWDETGWLHAAAGDAAAVALPMLRAWLDRLGERYEELGPEHLAAITGTRFYRTGLRLPGSVLVQSGALVRGLAAHLPPNVTLYEESPVLRIDSAGGDFRLVTAAGELRAARLFLAGNGYSPLLGVLADRVFPLVTFGSLTRPLAAAEQAALGGEREWGLLAEDNMGSTVRRTRDQRILIRNSVHYRRDLGVGDAVRERATAAHRQAFLARFPALADVPFEHTWAGVMGASPNRGHSFGEIEENLFTAAGYTGGGIAMGTTAGMLLADLALGALSRPLADMLALPAPTWLPPQPFLGLGIRLRVARMNAAAGPTL
ncbi:MAG TPA: FAD-binding oxidoreductase [Thermoanaerobaculia bacterium]|nr:FAD-binding oxidoreductase [Thermoanaerobaculia bacterium]